ncbi:MAG: hypothetical protein IJO73_08885 [Clostridia bacterium]|nr:hypothetical protein [Clostridia bacterium]
MNRLKKALKTLAALDLVFVSFGMVYSLVYPFLVDSIEFSRSVYLDYMLWSLLGALALAAVIAVAFTAALIIRTVRCKRIIKDKRVIGACIVNIAFIALMLVFIDKLDLWFIFC